MDVGTGRARGLGIGRAALLSLTSQGGFDGGRGQLLPLAFSDALAEQGYGQQAARSGGTGAEQPGTDARQDAHVHLAKGHRSHLKSR